MSNYEMHQDIEQLKEDVQNLKSVVDFLVVQLNEYRQRIIELKSIEPKQKMYNPNDLLVGKVVSLYHAKDYEYKDNNWAQFLISVDVNGRDEKFYRDILVGTPLNISEGDIISFRVHGTKIKEVNVLHEI